MDVDPLDLISPKRYGANGHPHELMAWMRQNSPVHWCEPDGYQNFWAVTRHADIIRTSGNHSAGLWGGKNFQPTTVS